MEFYVTAFLFYSLFSNLAFSVLANLQWEEWEVSFQQTINVIEKNPMIEGTQKYDFSMANLTDCQQNLFNLMKKVTELEEFSSKQGVDNNLNQRLKEPLSYAIVFCDKLKNGTERFTPMTIEAYLKSLMPKIRSTILGFQNNFDLFRMEVELKMIEIANFLSEIIPNYYEKLRKFSVLLEKNRQFTNVALFNHAKTKLITMLVQCGIKTKTFDDPEVRHSLAQFILAAKLSILEKELDAMIVASTKPRIDKDIFMTTSSVFLLKWKALRQTIENLSDSMDKKETFRKYLNDLAKTAILKTKPLKHNIAAKLEVLVKKSNETNKNLKIQSKHLQIFKNDVERADNEKKLIEIVKKDYQSLLLNMLTNIGLPLHLVNGSVKGMEYAEKELITDLNGNIAKFGAFEDLEKVLEAEKQELIKAFNFGFE